MKIVQLWMCMCSFSFSLGSSIYMGSFKVLLTTVKYRAAAPWHDMAAQIIWINIFLVKMLTHLPNVHVVGYILLHGAFVRKQMFHSVSVNGDDVWHSPVSFFSSLVSGVVYVPACET